MIAAATAKNVKNVENLIVNVTVNMTQMEIPKNETLIGN